LARLAGGAEHLVALQSPSFRKLGRPPSSYAESELLAMMLAEPRVLRRPLLLTDEGQLLVGRQAVMATFGRS
jgi:arsenate reductase-like glutaredoxin family protein